jgi:glutaconyl-CoA/methylmalonyl-CoA decarboxylase subunit delta
MTDSLLTQTVDSLELVRMENLEEVYHFTQNDPFGGYMALLGMGIVFLVLLILSIVFTLTPRLYTIDYRKSFNKLFEKKVEKIQEPAEKSAKAVLSGEVNAAIATALFLYKSELHDHENTILTISKVSRTYSPWSSKIYGLRNHPQKR